MLTVIFVAVALACCFGVDGIGGAVFGLVFGAMMGVFVAVMIGFGATPHTTYKTTVPLVNLVDNSETRGSFFLGSGSVDGVPVYSWYQQTAGNSYERRDADASDATIHYVTGGGKPRVVESVHHNPDGTFRTWYIVDDEDDYVSHYDFYIPRGSITREYKLDAK